MEHNELCDPKSISEAVTAEDCKQERSSNFSLPVALADSSIIRKPIPAVQSFLTQSLTSSAEIFVMSVTQV